MQGTLGWTMLAPAAREYAVLPVGVEIMIPAKESAHMSKVAIIVLHIRPLHHYIFNC